MLTSFVCQKKAIATNVARQELAKALWEKEALIWVDLENPDEFETETLVELFNFHPLAIEDCITEHSEPKIDDYEDYLFIVVHAAKMSLGEELKTIELNLFVNKHYVVTFHKEPLSSIAHVREQMRKSGSCLCDGIDMLVHSILDRLVDNYLPVLAEHERKIDLIEDQVFKESGNDFLERILKAQKDILYLKRIIGPQRDTISDLSRNAQSFVRPKNLIYFRDVYDHLFQCYQKAEELDNHLKSLLQIYFSHVSTELNQAIKKMTVIATVSLPCVMIASIYGMNFKHMPELQWQHGYFVVMGLMVSISLGLLFWMKKKKWF